MRKFLDRIYFLHTLLPLLHIAWYIFRDILPMYCIREASRECRGSLAGMMSGRGVSGEDCRGKNSIKLSSFAKFLSTIQK